MPLLLLDELVKHLDLPAEDVSTALSELVNNIKTSVENNEPAHIPGVGTFTQEHGALAFTPAEPLALAVNNRYAALDSEMVQLGFEEPEFPISETLDEGDEQEVDQSVIDQIIADDPASTNLFKESESSEAQQEQTLETKDDPFKGDLSETEPEHSNSPTVDAVPSEKEVEPASMKEEDPNAPKKSKQDPRGSDTEWSPFFEELEGEEFDIDNTIDLSAEDWQAEVPSPPSSPFASSSDSSNTNADDLYFDVDADPDDTLFAAASIDVESPTPNNEDMSWASAPLDDVTDFFEDDPSMDSSFGEEENARSPMSAEDEFFSPVSGTASASPDDTMFSPESIYAEEASTEADDTIFLAPDQTVDAGSAAEAKDSFAPPAQEKPAAPPPPPRSRNPYAYREERKKSTSAFPWVAAVIAAVIIVGGGLAYWQGWLPFGSGDPAMSAQTNTNSTPVETPQQSTTPPETDPVTDPAAAGGTETVAGGGSVDSPDNTTPQATPPAPVAQRIGFDLTRGGYTVVVASREQVQEAERIADSFFDTFGSSQLAIDLLSADVNASTWYRVGIGQFSSRERAIAFKDSDSRLPSDAWILRIE